MHRFAHHILPDRSRGPGNNAVGLLALYGLIGPSATIDAQNGQIGILGNHRNDYSVIPIDSASISIAGKWSNAPLPKLRGRQDASIAGRER